MSILWKLFTNNNITVKLQYLVLDRVSLASSLVLILDRSYSNKNQFRIRHDTD